MLAGECAVLGRLLHAAVAIVLLTVAAGVGAIDNPDAPDRVGAFKLRAAPLEQQLAATDGGSAAILAGQAYASFLDAELNTAYRMLLGNLQSPEREALAESQRVWLKFRSAELRFIARHWTRERSGSSASLSAAVYRNALTKERVVQLLRYAAEYQ
jgi:uncharacterized protein YecT (DUF1311 family)